METKKTMIGPAEFKALFASIEVIHNLNDAFYKELLVIIKPAHDVLIGGIFLRFMETLKLYSDYINNYELCISAFSLCIKNKKFKSFLDSCVKKPVVQGLDMMAYMIMPVQRVPRYELLLHEIAKHTPDVHPDFKGINLCVTELKKLIELFDKRSNKAEAQTKIINIQNNLIDYHGETLISPNRVFLMEGLFYEKRRSGPKYCFMFLFNDILLQTVQKKYEYKFKRIIPLHETRVTAIPNAPFENYTYSFKLSSSFGDQIFYASKSEEIEKWSAAIKYRSAATPKPKGVQSKIYNIRS